MRITNQSIPISPMSTSFVSRQAINTKKIKYGKLYFDAALSLQGIVLGHLSSHPKKILVTKISLGTQNVKKYSRYEALIPGLIMVVALSIP